MIRVAILVDAAFYMKQAKSLFGAKSGAERADELYQYCMRHMKETVNKKPIEKTLYRIFVYNCPPSEKVIMHPLTRKNVCLKKPTYILGQMIFMQL